MAQWRMTKKKYPLLFREFRWAAGPLERKRRTLREKRWSAILRLEVGGGEADDEETVSVI
jgi:hypothetical protein